MNKQDKQKIINEVTHLLKNRQWFNGAGFEDDTLVVAYNYYPAFELKEIKEVLSKCGAPFLLKDINVIRPDTNKDNIPPYVR